MSRLPRSGLTPATLRVDVRLTARELLAVDHLREALDLKTRGDVVRLALEDLSRRLSSARQNRRGERK